MRPGNNQRRPRGRPNRKQHTPSRNQTFDSHGPDVRIRGNAPQVYEKYLGLARDATSSGDRIAAESYYQFAEHYFRIINDSTDPQRLAPPQTPQQQRPQGEQSYAGQEQPRVDWPAGETVNGNVSGPANGEGSAPAAVVATADVQGTADVQDDGGDTPEQEPRPRTGRSRGPGRRRGPNGVNGTGDAAPREAAQPSAKSTDSADDAESDDDAAPETDDETVSR